MATFISHSPAETESLGEVWGREAQCGWKQMKLQGSPTFVLPSGKQIYSPALAGLDFDEEMLRVRSYTPPVRDALDIYRDLLAEAAQD